MKKMSYTCTAILLSLLLCACEYESPHPPMPEALDALADDDAVRFTEVSVDTWDSGSYYAFRPKDSEPRQGFIFYAGSGIDVRSYAPNARDIARNGYLVVLVSMPRDTALLAPDRAGTVIRDYPGIGSWAIGGHSMGGIAACQFASGNLDDIDAVILWASHPSEANRLDATGIAALSISASNDGVYPDEVIERSREHLPDDTVWVVIEGGNHFQFGWYLDDHKPTDGDAAITREEQTAQIVQATSGFLQTIGQSPAQ